MADIVEGIKVRKLVWDKAQGTFVAKSKARDRGRFLKGPIPLEWLTAAAQLRGKALATGLAVHYAAGLHSTHCDIPVSNEIAEVFGINRYAKRRALEQLAAAGLIRIAQSGKAAPRVTIVLKRGRLSSAFEAPRPSGPRDVSETAFRSRAEAVSSEV